MTSSPDPQLTYRQKEVLHLMLNGSTARQIARELNISTATVHSHLRAIYAALRVTNRTRAVVAALEAGYGQSSDETREKARRDRARVQAELRDAWKPCEVHLAYQSDCAVCVKAATLMYAIRIVQRPWAASPGSPPPAIVAAPVSGLGSKAPRAVKRGATHNAIQVPLLRPSD